MEKMVQPLKLIGLIAAISAVVGRVDYLNFSFQFNSEYQGKLF